MGNKKISEIEERFRTIAPLFILAVVLLAGCTQTASLSGDGKTTTGRAVFAITDPAGDMGSVSSVKITVDEVNVHSDANGWINASTTARTYDLLLLDAQGKQALLADVNLQTGSYDQVRLKISKVMVTDENGTHEAKLPSGELKIVGKMVVDANQTSTAMFDFAANESLHQTGNGQYIFAPVVWFETRSQTNVSINSNEDVQINGGNVRTNVKVGMNERGQVGTNLGIPANAQITVDNLTGSIKVNTQTNFAAAQGRTVFTMTDAASNMGTITSIMVTVESSSVHSDANGWTQISSAAKTYDLLELKASGRNALLADADLNAGTYDQIRLDISKVLVTDENGTHEAKLPSGEIKIMGNFDVNAGSATAASFDFNASKSIHVTGNGKYIFAPVINLQIREWANIDANSDRNVLVRDGKIRTDVEVGMDENGNVGEGLGIGQDDDVEIEGGRIKIVQRVQVSN